MAKKWAPWRELAVAAVLAGVWFMQLGSQVDKAIPEQPFTYGVPLPSRTASSESAVAPPRKERVGPIKFFWNAVPGATSYTVTYWIGPKAAIPTGGMTNIVTVTGTSYTTTVLYTNFSDRVWFDVVANATGQNLNLHSPASSIIFSPLFDPDRMEVTSSVPASIQSSADLRSWIDLGIAPVTVFFDQSKLFLRGRSDRPGRLSARPYNPLNP